jgi:voltage-gated sodium channel
MPPRPVTNGSLSFSKAGGDLLNGPSVRQVTVSDTVTVTDRDDPGTPGKRPTKTFEEIQSLWGLGPTRQAFVDSTKFNLAVGSVILANAVAIGVETELCRNDGCRDQEMAWRITEYVFCVVWVVEMVLRLQAAKLQYFYDSWNVMDFCLVTLAVMDAVLPTVQQLRGKDPETAENMKMFSVLRMLRLLRLVRVIRLLRIFKELWLLVNGFIHALRVLGWLVVLLLLILYCGAILTTAMIGEHCDEDFTHFERCKDMFGGVFLSMFTLFQVLTLEGWAMSVVRPIMDVYPSMVFFFLTFLFLTSFGLMNIVIGVIVENTLQAAAQNEDKLREIMEKELHDNLTMLREIFLEADVDQDGMMSRDEFRLCMDRSDVQEKLSVMELPGEEAADLFNILDEENKGEIDIEAFIGGALKLKGSAKSKDMMGVVVSQRSMLRRVERIESSLQRLEPLANVIPVLLKSLDVRDEIEGRPSKSPSSSEDAVVSLTDSVKNDLGPTTPKQMPPLLPGQPLPPPNGLPPA